MPAVFTAAYISASAAGRSSAASVSTRPGGGGGPLGEIPPHTHTHTSRKAAASRGFAPVQRGGWSYIRDIPLARLQIKAPRKCQKQLSCHSGPKCCIVLVSEQ